MPGRGEASEYIAKAVKDIKEILDNDLNDYPDAVKSAVAGGIIQMYSKCSTATATA